MNKRDKSPTLKNSHRALAAGAAVEGGLGSARKEGKTQLSEAGSAAQSERTDGAWGWGPLAGASEGARGAAAAPRLQQRGGREPSPRRRR